ncbi:MAG: LysE family transporter [bacterium]|nr:LysE family transporter [bacterium]
MIGFLAGFVIGFALSMPPLGPTYFAIIERGLKKEFDNAIAIGVGAGFMDMIYILVAYGGVTAAISLLPDSVSSIFTTNEAMIKLVLALLGCIVVIIYGIKIMRTKSDIGREGAPKFDEEKIHKKYSKVETVFKKTEQELGKLLHSKGVAEPNSDIAGSFFIGIVMCLSSVTLPASWFAIVGYLKSYGIIETNFLSGFLLSIGVLLGTSAWFYIMTKLIFKYTDRIKPKTLNKLNFFTGIFLILLGGSLLIKVSAMIFNNEVF